MENNYGRAYREVYEIINGLPIEYVEKLPKDFIEMIKSKMDNDYECKIDLDKSIEEQNFCEETEHIIYYLFKEYWATPTQKEKLENNEKYEDKIIEEEKSKKYNYDNLFNKKTVVNETNIEQKESINSKSLPIVTKKESIFKKLINFFALALLQKQKK